MEGVWYKRILLSIPSLLSSSTYSTAAATELVGGREIGDVEGKRVVGEALIGADVGASVGDFEGIFVEAPVPFVVDKTVVLEYVACVVVLTPTSM